MKKVISISWNWIFCRLLNVDQMFIYELAIYVPVSFERWYFVFNCTEK